MNSRAKLEQLFGDAPAAPSEKSNALRSFQYGNPANFTKYEREKCTGCKYERIIQAGEHIGVGVCQKKNADGSKRLYGTRCSDYRGKGTK